MAHSPPGSGAPQQQFGVHVGASPHMGNMVMGRNMIPHSPMNPNTQGHTPQPGQQPMQGHNHNQFTTGRPPSRTTTPADVHPSPSLTQRQVTGDIINMEVLNIPNATLEVLKGELGLAGKDVSALTSNDKVRVKLSRIALVIFIHLST
jgi:collagen type III alpha